MDRNKLIQKWAADIAALETIPGEFQGTLSFVTALVLECTGQTPGCVKPGTPAVPAPPVAPVAPPVATPATPPTLTLNQPAAVAPVASAPAPAPAPAGS